MPHRITLSVRFAVVALAGSAVPADAADLSTQSRLGAIFAEPVVPPRVVVVQPVRDEAPIIPYNLLPNPPWNRGNYNYGSSWSYLLPRPLLRRSV